MRLHCARRQRFAGPTLRSKDAGPNVALMPGQCTHSIPSTKSSRRSLGSVRATRTLWGGLRHLHVREPAQEIGRQRRGSREVPEPLTLSSGVTPRSKKQVSMGRVGHERIQIHERVAQAENCRTVFFWPRPACTCWAYQKLRPAGRRADLCNCQIPSADRLEESAFAVPRPRPRSLLWLRLRPCADRRTRPRNSVGAGSPSRPALRRSRRSHGPGRQFCSLWLSRMRFPLEASQRWSWRPCLKISLNSIDLAARNTAVTITQVRPLRVEHAIMVVPGAKAISRRTCT